MVYKLYEHQADFGVWGKGISLNKAFEEGAKAMFSIMCDLKSVKPSKKIRLKLNSADSGTLFVAWLNDLLAQRDIKNMLFSKFKAKIDKNGKKMLGEAWGEKLNPKKHKLRTEVKAATYSQLSVEKKGRAWVAQCVVDV